MSSRLRLIVPVVALPLLLTACGGEKKDETPTAAPATSSAAAPSATASASESPSAAPAFDGTEINVTIAGSKVSPRPSTHKVAEGTKIKVTVTSDKADELHVHGFDKSLELKAGQPGVIEFTADQTGTFEVETHESGLLLFKLEVS
ncbi:hypothetical protein [Actinocorallia longicatena]|uniref:EfeO-type cupredoxin-like domain-containing protein n=1 Tax=Actinocorallia longicatena TaxID=111803 RepID=A0ABP6PYL0_9ACTN